MKSKEELSKIASQNAKKLWSSISKEEKAKLLNATILNPDIRNASKEARSAGLKKKWAETTVEERAIRVANAKAGVQKAKGKKSDSMKKYWASKSPEERQAHYKKTIGTKASKAKVAKSVKQIWDDYTPEQRKARLNNSSHSEKARLGRVANWEKLSPDEKSNWIKVHLRRRHWKMTGIEKTVSIYLDKYFPDEWKYNGCRNHNVVINGKIPDFVNVNGKKAVVEVLGKYWHKLSEVEPLKRHYLKYGFNCVIIWEDECNEVDLRRILGGQG